MTAVAPENAPTSEPPVDDGLPDTGPPDTTPLAPLWLSHHYACDADRCVRLGRVHVCRRCSTMFLGFFPALAVLLSPWRESLQLGDAGLVLGVAAFAGIEFVQVVRRRVPYSPRRVLLLSPAVGALLAWLGVSGFRDGLGPAHMVLGGTALAVLGVLLAYGSVVRRAHTAG